MLWSLHNVTQCQSPTNSAKEYNELSSCLCNDIADLIEYVGEIQGKVNMFAIVYIKLFT